MGLVDHPGEPSTHQWKPGKDSPVLQVKQVRGYMKDDNFTLDNIKAISSAGAGLLKWVFAMVNYYDVAKGVEPKRKKVADSERSLRIAERDLSTMKVHSQCLSQPPG